jgi:UDP-N-acetylmuramate--alanine ligase
MNYFLTGIKGSGMTGLACILKDLGNQVTGSDVADIYFTDSKLDAKAIEYTTFNADNITTEIDTLILGNAFNEEHPEVVKANELGINIIRYYDYIAKLAREFNSIAIAGTNGKTTTTGITACMLQDQDVMYLIGDGTGVASVGAKNFVYEACEYKNTFLNYFSKFGLINNVEMDHPDFFTSIEHVIETYQNFANQCEVLIINNDDDNCKKITHQNKITYGINQDAIVQMKNIVASSGGYNFDLYVENKLINNYFVPFQGMHMIYNTLASIAIAHALGLSLDNAINNITKFTGTTRRFQVTILDADKDIILVDDYAHHPTAIEFTIDAIKQKYPEYQVSVIFQPHTYSRTITFLDDFAQSLTAADNIYLADIFGSVREAKGDFDISILANAVEKLGYKVEKDLNFINKNDNKHVIAVLGAGNVDKIYIPEINKILKG